MIDFVEENIVHRFSLPKTIMVDEGPVFTGEQFMEYARKCGIGLLHLTSYYAQANIQAETSNKSIKNVIWKIVDGNPHEWHELFLMMLWAIRTSKWSSTGTILYTLTYGHDAILPKEVVVQSLRIVVSNQLISDEYAQVMLIELEDLDKAELNALDHL